MGLFERLKQTQETAKSDLDKLARAWGVDASDLDTHATEPTDPDVARVSAYDRKQWVKKLRRILDELPETRGEWDVMEQEAKALGLPATWVRRHQHEEFAMLIRRAVADRVLTEDEKDKLEEARRLVGLSEQETDAMVDTIVAEAEKFFGGEVEGA